MIVGKVVGNIVCTQKDKSLNGQKMLIVQPVNLKTLKEEGAALVALDATGAGQGELVLVVGGSSARLASNYEKIAVDQAIIGILDSIDIQGESIYRKEGDKIW
jgi:ethanolamine utilization protein EutN